MSHPFRPPIQPPPSARSTESPMDFTYDTPSSNTSSIRPLDLIDQNGNRTTTSLSSQTHHQTTTPYIQSSWFSSLRSSPQHPRKRLHRETESMDWETCPPEPKPKLFPNLDSTTRAPLGGTFLFQPPKELQSLPQPPVFTPPSPQKIGPEAYGLHPRSRSENYRENHDPDSSLDIHQVILKPNTTTCLSKMYSNNAVRHESRRRTRAQKQLRSKLGSLSFDTDNDNDDDSDVEVLSSQKDKLLLKPKNYRKQRQDLRPPKSDPITATNNYLTINDWKGIQQQNPSQLSTDTPYILLVYLQLLFNSSLVFVGLYLAINLILIIRTDINHKVLVHTTRLRQEIEQCTKEYHSNRCYPIEQRTQFIEKHCIQWEAFMNGFVDVISWKTMLFIFLSIGAGIYATNLAMNNYKSKWEPYHHHQRSHPSPASSWAPRLTPQTTSTPSTSSKEIQNQTLDPIAIFGQDQKK
ncbi:hypothetical protein VP01_1472g5 [Puccinia sorghi]|uniref:Brl1/Brr6 domain-containing protein n=1 Tax=Puccinia sorghi TaxID=27349 RepID=A0A0L6VJM2_9BASI|nr:hypothetical protein VP01_1472g5 [Puccinia sorghi]